MGEPETTGHGRASIIDAINAEYESEYGEKLIQDNGEVAGKNFRYSAERFDVSGEMSQPGGLVSDGETLIVSDVDSSGDLYQYSFGTEWDLSTLSYDNVSTNVSNEDTLPGAMISDGETLIRTSEFSGDLLQYSMDPWDLSTLSYDGVRQDSIGANGLASDGETVLVAQSGGGVVDTYQMDPAWDLSTLSNQNEQLDVTISGSTQAPGAISSDTEVLVVGDDGDGDLFQYDYGAGWDVTKATFDGARYIGSELEDNHGSADGMVAGGSRLIVADAPDAFLHSYTYHERFQIPEP